MAVPNPTQKPQPSKRLFMWATRGSRLAAKLYVSKDAAESCYGEMAKRRRAS